MEYNCKVSIIMPAYNAAKYIQASIDSVRQQTFTNWELIIINDGSTDNTIEIVKENERIDTRIKLINQKNSKQGAARNAGLRLAKGEWIAFIDADDLWMPQKLETQLLPQFDADVIYTGGTILFEENKTTKRYQSEYGAYTGSEMYNILFCRYNIIPNLSVMMKAHLVSKIGYQDESMEINCSEDWEYWLRLARNGVSFYGINENLFIYRVHALGSSQNQIRMQEGLIYLKFKNIDYNLIQKDVANAQLKNICEPLIRHYLLLNEALKTKAILRILKTVSPRIRYNLIYFLLSEKIHIKPKLLILLLHPSIIKSLIKKIFFFNKYDDFKFWVGKKIQSLINHTEHTTNFNYLKSIPQSQIGENLHLGRYTNFNIFGNIKQLILEENISTRQFCNFLIYPNASLVVKKNVFFNNYCSINCLFNIEIGENTLFGEGVKIYDHNHKNFYDDKGVLQIIRDEFSMGAVIIGKNCWIASNVTILKGVTIGDNCIIGANCLIYKSIPANTIVKNKQDLSIQSAC